MKTKFEEVMELMNNAVSTLVQTENSSEYVKILMENSKKIVKLFEDGDSVSKENDKEDKKKKGNK